MTKPQEEMVAVVMWLMWRYEKEFIHSNNVNTSYSSSAGGLISDCYVQGVQRVFFLPSLGFFREHSEVERRKIMYLFLSFQGLKFDFELDAMPSYWELIHHFQVFLKSPRGLQKTYATPCMYLQDADCYT